MRTEVYLESVKAFRMLAGRKEFRYRDHQHVQRVGNQGGGNQRGDRCPG